MKVNYFNKTKIKTEEIRKTLNHVFSFVDDDKTMNIVFVSNKKIHEMNLYFRNIDRPTDVLSFEEDDIESLGDIFISLEKALEQSVAYGHSFLREVAFLAVHGYLHLKGYDHKTKEEEKKMIDNQEEILKKAGLERKWKWIIKKL